MLNWMRLIVSAALAMYMVGVGAAPPTNAELKKQVADTERAFAAAMKARDHGGGHLLEAVFRQTGGAVLTPSRPR